MPKAVRVNTSPHQHRDVMGRERLRLPEFRVGGGPIEVKIQPYLAHGDVRFRELRIEGESALRCGQRARAVPATHPVNWQALWIGRPTLRRMWDRTESLAGSNRRLLCC